jgi:hypothetical protein
MTQIKAKDLTTGEHTALFDRLPSSCPMCHQGIEPIASFRIGVIYPGRWLEIVLRCPRPECQQTFIARYRHVQQTQAGYHHKFLSSVPIIAAPAKVDPDVAGLSPAFVKIYNQALSAEAAGLDEVFGISLRKALEFLIKDYCIRNHPSEAREIKEKFLGKVIKDYVTDPNVKKCAERAIWLGNDETHYMRVWETHDIDDLKALIRLTVNWIANELLTAKYFSSMPSSGGTAP